MNKKQFKKLLSESIEFNENPFHPLVWINGTPKIGKGVYIGGMSEVNANGAKVVIGDYCDIASFVSINCADSHKMSIGLAREVDRRDITLEEKVFVGSHSVIKGGAYIGHHSVVAAGTIVEGVKIPPYSLIIGNPMVVKEGYYRRQEDSSIIAHNKPTLGKEEQAASLKVLKSGWLSQHKEVEEFENEFSDFMGLSAGHAIAVSSGTAALFLALQVLGAKGKKVAIPAYSCTALRNAVKMVDAQEVLVDSSVETPNLDLQKLNEADSSIAIIPHMYGIPQDLSEVEGKLIIEDCAQALGAKVKNQNVGLQGEIGIFSFYATKMITSGGQGGMIVSKNKKWIDNIRDIRDFDMKNDNQLRFNFQMTEIQAAIGRVQLSKLQSFIKRRKKIFSEYSSAKIPLLTSKDMLNDSVPFRAIIKTQKVDHLIEILNENNIKAINPLEEFELLGGKSKFLNAFNWTQNTLSIPIYPGISDAEIEKIINVLRNEVMD